MEVVRVMVPIIGGETAAPPLENSLTEGQDDGTRNGPGSLRVGRGLDVHNLVAEGGELLE